MKKALIIGSEGNIGKPLAEYLRISGFSVLESDHKPAWRDNFIMADICNPGDLRPAFDWQPDYVFLLAAMVSRVTCEQASSLAVQTNLTGVQNVLDLTKRSGSKLIYLSTSEVYGPDMPVMSENEVPNPNNRYGLTKYLSEYLVEYEVRQYGLRAVTLRPFMIYDENENFGDHRSAMIRFAYNLAVGSPIVVHRGGLRGWLHISDAVKILLAAAELNDYAVINIGHGDVRPISELAQLMCEALGADPALITERELPERMTRVKVPDLTLQKELLGIIPQISLEDGVKRVATRTKERLKGLNGLKQDRLI